MSIHVAIRHTTRYAFDRPVNLSPHVIRLRPAAHCRTPIAAYTLRVEPAQHFINWQQDPFGNYLARAVFPERTRELRVDVEVIADMTVINPFDFFVEEYAERWPFDYPEALNKELTPYLEADPAGPLLEGYLQGIDRRPQNTVDFLVALNQRPAARHRLHHPARAGRADARGDARARARLLPRHRLAAGPAAAPPRARGALRLRLPGAAHAGREVARRPVGA